MSPLVRSLLALAALLAAAQTQKNCKDVFNGNTSLYAHDLPPQQIPSPGKVVFFPNGCAPGKIAGDWVHACNNDPDGLPPLVDASDYTFAIILCLAETKPDLSCPKGLTLEVKQYCDYNNTVTG